MFTSVLRLILGWTCSWPLHGSAMWGAGGCETLPHSPAGQA